MFPTAGFVPVVLHLCDLVAQGVSVLGLGPGLLEGVQVGEQVRGRPWAPEHGWQGRGLAVAVHTEAALARDVDQSRCGTGRRRQGDVCGAAGHAAHRPVHTRALVLAARLEVLSVLIHPAVILTRATFQFSPADSVDTGRIVAIVTVQALVMVAGSVVVAVVVQLRGTHRTAAAAVGHRAHTRRARGTLTRTPAHLRTPRTHRCADAQSKHQHTH